MTPEELARALEGPRPLDAAAEAALAARVRADATAVTARVVELARSPDPMSAFKARSLAGRLEELVAGTLLDAAPPADAATAVWTVTAATAATVGLRARVAERVRALLGDRRLLPAQPADTRVEEPVRPRRVCDEAYGLLRELLETGESRPALVMDRWAFLRLPEAERDAEIARVLTGQPFTRLLEDREA